MLDCRNLEAQMFSRIGLAPFDHAQECLYNHRLVSSSTLRAAYSSLSKDYSTKIRSGETPLLAKIEQADHANVDAPGRYDWRSHQSRYGQVAGSQDLPLLWKDGTFETDCMNAEE